MAFVVGQEGLESTGPWVYSHSYFKDTEKNSIKGACGTVKLNWAQLNYGDTIGQI